MKYLEVPAALKRASLEDLFIISDGEIRDVRLFTTIFYRSLKTNKLEGPYLIYNSDTILELFVQQEMGMIGVLTTVPNEIKNEVIFDLVLREATLDDFTEGQKLMTNRLYYTYANKQLIGPIKINENTSLPFINTLIHKKECFVPHKKQHFKMIELISA